MNHIPTQQKSYTHQVILQKLYIPLLLCLNNYILLFYMLYELSKTFDFIIPLAKFCIFKLMR